MNDDNITGVIAGLIICLMVFIIFGVGIATGYSIKDRKYSPSVYQDVTINGVQYRAIPQGK